ncbi:MAG TPA: response regulator transcription factor [Methylomirabilota bacterium]|nr:response regulator transcription factor [Methylomirabilota bacterium]
MKKIRLLLADDHAILRAGLRMLLDAQPDMLVVAEAADGEEAVRRAAAIRPDVAIVDLTMPGLSGVETLGRLRREVPATRLLVLTMHDDPGYARLAMEAGAAGHVIKDAESSELLAAIRAVHRGRTFVQLGPGASVPGPAVASATPLLSPRERQVLDLLAHGHTNRQVADRLSLSVKTVETHRARLSEKLGLHGRADLVRLALDLGLLR